MYVMCTRARNLCIIPTYIYTHACGARSGALRTGSTDINAIQWLFKKLCFREYIIMSLNNKLIILKAMSLHFHDVIT